ncbi:MAG: cytochrome c3 family protein [Polyangiales bacterium]
MRSSIAFLFLVVSGCGQRDQPRVFEHAPTPSVMPPTIIHEPEKLWSIETGKVDALGRPIRAACVTCHSQRKPEKLPEKPEDLKQFHNGLVFAHGTNRCASCHVIGDQDSLRLADGTLIPNREAMRLCGQCHGPQLRDYQHGSHGGMNGTWDLASGARTRNHCVDCHDPHIPRFQPSVPVLPPHDRGLGPPIEHPEGPAIPKLSVQGGHQP